MDGECWNTPKETYQDLYLFFRLYKLIQETKKVSVVLQINRIQHEAGK
jgi:hypothetical protein